MQHIIHIDMRIYKFMWCYAVCKLVTAFTLCISVFYHAKYSQACFQRLDICQERLRMLTFIWCSRLLRSCIKLTYCCSSSDVKRRSLRLSSQLAVSPSAFSSADTWPTLVMIDRKYWFISPPRTLMVSHSSFFSSHNRGGGVKYEVLFLYAFLTSLYLRQDKCRFCLILTAAVLCNNKRVMQLSIKRFGDTD